MPCCGSKPGPETKLDQFLGTRRGWRRAGPDQARPERGRRAAARSSLTAGMWCSAASPARNPAVGLGEAGKSEAAAWSGRLDRVVGVPVGRVIMTAHRRDRAPGVASVARRAAGTGALVLG